MNNFRHKIESLIASGTPFAVVRRPGDKKPLFFDSISEGGIRPSTGPYFRFVAWDEGEPSTAQTCRSDYLAGLRALIAELSDEMPKAVISRTICGSIEPESIGLRVESCFETYPEALCCLFYTPERGFWLMASPELLLRDDGNGHYSTMALAGTRPKGESGSWSLKNLREHRYVVDFISNVFIECGLQPELSHTETVPYGNIEHLLTKISTSGNTEDFGLLADRLHPTPALCGTPRLKAREAIERTEAHRRSCYGGYIEFRIPESNIREAFVILRCARIDKSGHWTVYAGGGIVSDSVPEEEWIETERKSRAMLDFLK